MSRVARLGAGAVQEYREAGWHITAGDRPDAGLHAGPCGRCRAPCLRYGPAGQALCDNCQGDQ